MSPDRRFPLAVALANWRNVLQNLASTAIRKSSSSLILPRTANISVPMADQRSITPISLISPPSLGSVFYRLECTEVGGETSFISMYAVHDALPEERRTWLTQQKAVFDYPWNHEIRMRITPATAAQIANTPRSSPMRAHASGDRRRCLHSPI